MTTLAPTTPDAADSARLLALVRRAAAVLPTTWPLETFIAVNPLGGLEHLPFEEAGARARELFGAAGSLSEAEYRRLYAEGRIASDDLRHAARAALASAGLDPEAVVADRTDGSAVSALDVAVADLLEGDVAAAPARVPGTFAHGSDALLGTSLAAFVDDEAARWAGVAAGAEDAGPWAPPGIDRGPYAAWRALAVVDRRLPRGVRRRLGGWPEDAGRALLAGLAWSDDEAMSVSYLTSHLTALPGWASLLHRRGTAPLVEYLALRVALEQALVGDGLDRLPPARAHGPSRPDLDPGSPAGVGAPDAPDARLQAALHAAGLDGPEPVPGRDAARAALDALPAATRPWIWLAAHEHGYRTALLGLLPSGRSPSDTDHRHAAVFCIDPRSEGLRRHLEADGRVGTFGFAGFFAVAMSYRDVALGDASPQCPVLVEPRFGVDERASPGAVEAVARSLRGRRLVAGAHDGFHEAKDDLVGPYALAEVGGWVAAPVALARTLTAGAYGRTRAALRNALEGSTSTELVPEPAITGEEQVLFARILLTSTGLHHSPARLVLLCGHGSTTENNPYASSLDCGACGGHRGAPNARIAAGILNRAEVRAALADRGITVPDDTWFVAGEHDTATDLVTLLDTHLVPDSHRDDLADLADRLDAAGGALAAERAETLPGTGSRRPVRSVRRRSVDWAQVMPEWGLAGNAAFVVAPREATLGVDLGRRVFLHSYDADGDDSGDALETILTAPMVVAQWINCQYYFSSVAPDVFGAGTKTVHNVTAGGAGVLSGAGGDLRLGLPWQSVGWGDRLVHEPLRLLTVVEAPRERIDRVVERNQVLRRLFGNGWVALVAREDPDGPWAVRGRDGTWRPWSDADGHTGVGRPDHDDDHQDHPQHDDEEDA